MKKILLALVLPLACFTMVYAQDQIPNGSFENFTSAPFSIDGWTPISGNVGVFNSITYNSQTVNAYDGSRFLLVQSDTVNSQVFAGSVITNFAIDYRPDTLAFHGMYFPSNSTDKWQMILLMTKHNTTTSQKDTLSFMSFGPSTSNPTFPWARFSVGMQYRAGAPANPDSCVILIRSFSSSQSTAGFSSALAVDNMMFIKNPVTSITGTQAFINATSVYPNPFKGAATISYSLEKASNVTLEVYDMQGRLVSTLVNGMKPAGEHKANFDAAGLEPGVYIYKLQAGDAVKTERMILAE